MSFITDLSSLAVSAVVTLGAQAPATLRNACVFGVVLGLACWVACWRWTLLINLGYRFAGYHHGLCAVALVATICSTLVFAAAGYVSEAATAAVRSWRSRALLAFDTGSPVSRVCEDFRNQLPFVSRMGRARCCADTPSASLSAAAVWAVASEAETAIANHVDTTARKWQLNCVVVFFGAQLIAFSAAGYAAFRNLNLKI